MPITIRPEALVCDHRGGKHVYLVSGRIPNDDDDSAYLIQAEDEAHAWEILKTTLIDESGLSEEELETYLERHEAPVYGISCLLVGDITED